MTSYSQAGQDAWVVDKLGPEPGFFVDVGAYDGIEHSNTYALEQLGWNGLCVEPGPAFHRLQANRLCQVSQQAASDVIGGLLFTGTAVADDGAYVPCATLDYLLDTIEAPQVIDYLSIDVEGHELHVLDGLDFDYWHVTLATIEHNLYIHGPKLKEAVHSFMVAHDFERVREDVVAPGYGPYEDWWQHR